MIERWQIVKLLEMVEQFINGAPNEAPNLSTNMALVEQLYCEINNAVEPRVQ